MKIVGMARLYQEQHKFDQAITVYRREIPIASKAFMYEVFREVVLRWLHISVKACLRKTRAGRDPGYRKPRISGHLSDVNVYDWYKITWPSRRFRAERESRWDWPW